MAWGGRDRVTAAVVTAAVLLVLPACSADLDQAHVVQTRLRRDAAVADVDVAVVGPDHGARISLVLDGGVDDAGVLALVASVDEVAASQAYPSYRLDLESAGDTLVVDDSFGADPRAAAVVAAWRRAASAFIGTTALTYEEGRTTVVVTSDGGLAHDVAEASRLAPPPKPLTWRFASGSGTVVLDGAVAAADVDLVERVQRGVVSPSLPLAAVGWRLERRRTQVELDLRADLGTTASADLTPAAWGDRVAPLATVALMAVGQPRRRVVVRLTRTTDAGTDVFGWWTSDQPPADGRDRLDRGWDAWLVQVAGT